MTSMIRVLVAGTMALGGAPAFAQPVPRGQAVRVSPAVIARDAVAACQTHVRQSTWGGLADARAGAEQDGLLLVSGRVIWRGTEGSPSTFGCIYDRRARQVVSAFIPPAPAAPRPARDPAPAMFRTACHAAVTRAVAAQYAIEPTFDAASERVETSSSSNMMSLWGRGALSSGRGRGIPFTYFCEGNPQTGRLTAHSFNLGSS